METEALALAHSADFSLWALFARATLTVKLVMIVLVIASIWTWAIIINKHRDYRRARIEAEVFDEAFWSGEPLEGLYDAMFVGLSNDRDDEVIFTHFTLSGFSEENILAFLQRFLESVHWQS